MVKPKMVDPVSPFIALNRNLARLSTQVEYKQLPLEAAVTLARECFNLAINGTEVEQRAGRAAGSNLATMPDEIRKQTASDLKIPAPIVKKYIKDAAVPESDYSRWVEEKRKKGKKLTDAGLRRIGKPQKGHKKLTAAERVLQGLTPWLNSVLLRSVGRGEYAGSQFNLDAVSTLLEQLITQFAECVTQIRLNRKLQ